MTPADWRGLAEILLVILGLLAMYALLELLF